MGKLYLFLLLREVRNGRTTGGKGEEGTYFSGEAEGKGEKVAY